MVNGMTCRPFSAGTIFPFSIQQEAAGAGAIIEMSRKKYGRPREEVEEEITPQKQAADSKSGADTTVVKADTAVVEPRTSETDQKAKSTADGPVALKVDTGEEMVEMTLSTLANMMGKVVTGEKGDEPVEMKISEFVIAVGDVKASEVLRVLKK